MTAVTRKLAEFVAGLSYETLPVEVRDRVKALALDLVGITLRARNDAESTPAMVSAAALLGLTKGSCTVIGDGNGYTPAGAAMVNGTLAHSLDRRYARKRSAPEGADQPCRFRSREMRAGGC